MRIWTPTLVRTDYRRRYASCKVSCMETVAAKRRSETARADGPAPDLERECETWDWARAAGVSAQDLRKALRESRSGGEAA